MNIPGPREQLGGCIWLPRILAKARLLQAGQLPPDFAARFCHSGGVDGQFLAQLGLNQEEILKVAALPDTAVVEWLRSRCRPEQIEQWNHIAINLGRPGFPMAERLPVALATSYKHIDPLGKETLFEVLEADDRLLTTP